MKTVKKKRILFPKFERNTEHFMKKKMNPFEINKKFV